MTQLNLSMKEKENHGHREQTRGCQERGLRMGWSGSLGLIDAAFYVECINHKIFVYSTEYYI